MGESEKSSDLTAEKVPTEDQARHSTSGFMVTSAMCCVVIVLLLVLLTWTGSSSTVPAADIEKRKGPPDTTEPAGPTMMVTTTPTAPPDVTRVTHTSTTARSKPGSGKTTSELLTEVAHTSTTAATKPGSEDNTAEGKITNNTAQKTIATTPPPRPTPPYTLICTLGPYMNESIVFPEDGLCGYIMLDWLPVTKAADLARPFEANVTRFLSVAASYRGTEFGIAFDSKAKVKMMKLLDDPTAKAHLDALYEKRIWHFGYINTNNFALNITDLNTLMKVLKKLKGLMKDKVTPDHQAGTFLAAAWRARLDRVSIHDLETVFRISGNPDLFISKAHLSDPDMTFHECLILPSTFLERPVPDSEGGSIYEYSLSTAFKHASDVEKRVPELTVAVSVGLQGRWYWTRKSQAEDPQLGHPCETVRFAAEDHPFESFATACLSPHVQKNEQFNCKYIVNKTAGKVFTFDDVETLRYKLCTSKKNTTSLKMGIMAAGLEFADAGGRCEKAGMTFPLLRALKNLVMFFKDHYASEKDFEKCLSQGAGPQS